MRSRASAGTARRVLLDLLGEYGVDGSRALIRSLDARLRAAGAPAPLLPPAHPGPGLLAPLRAAAEAAGARSRATRARRPRATCGAWRASRRCSRAPRRIASCSHSRRRRARPRVPWPICSRRRSRRRARVSSTRSGLAVAALLARYREAYRARKEAELALDFDDLQERACELLERDEIGAAVRERFDLVLVDEFQDTNGLQCRLLDALAGPGCQRMYVGDACQSIYRFRYADVELFRARGEQAELRLPLTGSYRSRPELLAGHRTRVRRALRRARLRAAARVAHRRADGRAGVELHLVASDEIAVRAGPARELEADAPSRGACASSSTAGSRRGDIAILLRFCARRIDLRARAGARRAGRAQPARPRLLPLAAGTRPVRVPRAAAQPLRRPRAARRARLATRRRLQRRAGSAAHCGAGSALLADRDRAAGRAARGRPRARGALQAALRRTRARCRRARARGAARARRGGARLRAGLPDRARRRAPLRQRAQAGAGGARLRARSRARPGRIRRSDAALRRARPERGGRTARRWRGCGRADDDPCAKGLEFPVVCVPDLSRPTPGESGAVASAGTASSGCDCATRAAGRSAGPCTPVCPRRARRPTRPRATAWRTSPGRGRATACCWAAGSAARRTASSSACSASSASSPPRSSQVSPMSTSRACRCACTSTPARTSAVDASWAAPGAGRDRARGAAQPVRPAARGPGLPRPARHRSQPLPAAALHVPRALSYSALALHDRCGFRTTRSA